MKVSANVGGLDDVLRAVDVDADGIGLFRTEFLFLDRDAPPTEDEQYEVYAKAVSSFSDPVVIRTLDIGGDKPAPLSGHARGGESVPRGAGCTPLLAVPGHLPLPGESVAEGGRRR